ncbi:MAG: TIGR04282 family arsenosugar biosynthesis glycosyltransferase [Hyphomicrobiales bacterium]|nr:TIGR04282 family arsenosugar biosynthesis glycosyltransferase [Hyphomicrobiales bacterium]
MKPAIGLMCKPPRAGVSKTRLAASIGAEAAARLSGAFLADVAETLGGLQARGAADVTAFHKPADADAVAQMRALIPASIPLRAVGGDELGAAMLAAIKRLLGAGAPAALLIGADLPTLPAALVSDATARLASPDVDCVFGPSEDGGYYLIGLKLARAEVFTGVRWSTARVLEESLERAAEAGLRVSLAPPWFDVDDWDGLQRLKADLAAAGPELAPHTRLALAEL